MPQHARPSSDISKGGWADGGAAEVDGVLWNSLDETTQDGDTSYIVADNAATTFKVKLSAVADPGVDTEHQLVIYMRSDGAAARRSWMLSWCRAIRPKRASPLLTT